MTDGNAPDAWGLNALLEERLKYHLLYQFTVKLIATVVVPVAVYGRIGLFDSGS